MPLASFLSVSFVSVKRNYVQVEHSERLREGVNTGRIEAVWIVLPQGTDKGRQIT